MFPSGGNVAVN